ncbi:unnamed protein product [Clonostachys rosea]|uniref:CBM-cenC domain-containing protein n=1 Tax=Bionectria ochroleuca TaxID=29856 RepID=A0ABY6U485_BIOOC|nr:unnamed protein product [Clonostachys rosea]
MINSLFLGSLLLLPSLGQAASLMPRLQQDICGPQPNLVLNPSWELGTSGWTYSNNFSPQITTDVASDGAQSLSVTGAAVYSTWTVRQSVGGGTLDRTRPYTFSVDITAAAYPPYAGPLICQLQAYHCQTYNYIFDKTVAFNPSSTPSAFVTYSGSFTPPNLVEDIVISGNCRYSTQSSFPTPGPFVVYIDNARFSMDAPACPSSTPVSTIPSTTSPVSTPEPTPSSTSTDVSATTTPADSTTVASTTPSESTTPSSTPSSTPSESATPSATSTESSTPIPSDTTTPTPTTLATFTTPSSTVPSGTITSQPESLTPTSSSTTPLPTTTRPCRRRNRRAVNV